MNNPITDWPPWINAFCGVMAIIISIITAFKSKKYHTEYALVSSDGKVLSHKGFSNYGLHVSLDTVPIDDSRPDHEVAEYKVKFSKLPSYFEVTTREGAVVDLKQDSPLSYKLRFVGVGHGDPIIQCNFKIQAY